PRHEPALRSTRNSAGFWFVLLNSFLITPVKTIWKKSMRVGGGGLWGLPMCLRPAKVAHDFPADRRARIAGGGTETHHRVVESPGSAHRAVDWGRVSRHEHGPGNPDGRFRQRALRHPDLAFVGS